MRALSILALVLSLVFFTAVASQPIFAATQKSSNNGNNGNDGDNAGGDQNQDQVKNQEKKEEKEQNKEDKNQNKEENKEQNKDDKNLNKEQNKEQNKEDKNQNKEQNKAQVKVKTKDPKTNHGISRKYEAIEVSLSILGDSAFFVSLPILEDLTFSADTTFEILWTGRENDVNLSAKGNNYRAKIDEGTICIKFSNVKIDEEPRDDIEILLSIEGGLFNQHSPASGANANGKAELYLRAKSMTVMMIGDTNVEDMDLVLEHPMIKIQDGEFQFIKIAIDDIVDQYLAPPRVENKQYTTFGKIKSTN